MPTYEYACKGCGEHLEVVQSFRDDALTECPSCHGQLRKVFSAAGLIFKGSGWHVKDYADSKHSSGRSSAKDESGASSEGGAGDSSDGGEGSATKGADSSDSSSSPSSSGTSSSDTPRKSA